MDIDYLYFLQQIRESGPEFVNLFFYGVSEIAAFVAIAVSLLLYWCFDGKSGAKSLFAYGSASHINQLIKQIACVYRPWIKSSKLHVDLRAAASATGYSFPSGHTVGAATGYGSIGKYLWKKKKWPMAVCVIMTLLTAFSRNFLGAHTPQDVLVALLIAVVVLFLVDYIFEWIDKKENNDLIFAAATLAVIIVSWIFIEAKSYPMDYVNGVLLVDPEEMKIDCYNWFGVFLGFIPGYLFERRYIKLSREISNKSRILRFILGFVVCFGLYKGLKPLLLLFMAQKWVTFFRMFALSLSAMGLMPWIFKKLENKDLNERK